METRHPAEELSAMLAEKGKAYDEFQSATDLLKGAIENEEIASINRLIKRRDELIGNIDELDGRIKRHWHSVPLDQRSAVIRRVASISDDLYGKLERINSTNHECTSIAARSCAALQSDLMVINQTKEGLQGYAGMKQRIPKFFSVRT